MNGSRATLRRMNPTRPFVLVALALALPLVLSACGNKGPLVRATPVPASIDGTPTIDAPVEGEAVPAEESAVEEPVVEDTVVEGADPSDEIVVPEDEASAESEVVPPEDEPTPEPAPEPVPPDATPNG